MSDADIVRDGLDAYWDAPSEAHAALARLTAENERLQGQRDAGQRREDGVREMWHAAVAENERLRRALTRMKEKRVRDNPMSVYAIASLTLHPEGETE